MTNFFFGIVLLAFTYSASAQAVQQDIDWYRSFAIANFSADEKLAQANRDLQEAIDSHDLPGESLAAKTVGLIYVFGFENYEKAMDQFIRCLTIEDSLDLKKEKVFTYVAMADVFEATGNLKKSDELFEQALVINRQLEDQHNLAFILTKQGKIKADDGQLEIAEASYKTVLTILETIDDPVIEAQVQFCLAAVLTKQRKLQLALDTYKKALTIYRSENDDINEAVTLNEIGNLYAIMKNNEKALANHVVALEIRQRLKDKSAIAESYNNIGALYLEQGNLERAVANVDLALASAQPANDQYQMSRSYDLLSQGFKQAGDYEKALKYRDLYVGMSDFIQRDINLQKIADDEMNYQLEKKKSQIDKLEAIRTIRERELAAERQTKLYLYAVIGLVVVVLFMTLNMYFIKRRSNKKLQLANETVSTQNVQLKDLNATKDKFFSIISHDLKGPLNSLTSFSGLLINHTDALSKDEIRMLAKDLDKSLKNLFALLENLLEWSRSQTGNIDFKPESFDLSALLQQNKELLMMQAQNKKIEIINTSADPISITAHKHSINTVVRNLISNAIKFTPAEGRITLSTKTNNDRITVAIADTGVGMTREVMDKLFRIDTKHTTKGTAEEKGTGLGLILCKDFIEKNGGRIWVTSEVGKGSVFSFELPFAGVTSIQKVSV